MKFRKKPVVIEAFQVTRETRASNVDWPEWMHRAWNGIRGEAGALWFDGEHLMVGTLEEPHRVTDGDWLIQGIRGELYPCKPDIFAATYEAVEVDKEMAEAKR